MGIHMMEKIGARVSYFGAYPGAYARGEIVSALRSLCRTIHLPRAALLSSDARVEDVTFGGHAIAIVMVGFDDKHKRIKFVSSWGSFFLGRPRIWLSFLRLRRETSIERVDLHSSHSIRDPDSQV